MAFRSGFAFSSMTIGPLAAAAILAEYLSAALALEAVVADRARWARRSGRRTQLRSYFVDRPLVPYALPAADAFGG
jgi:hypothetical protein